MAHSSAQVRRGSLPGASAAVFPHVLLGLVFGVAYFLLNRPEVIVFSQLGFTSWYPPTGLALALMLGISPRYLPLVILADAVAGAVTYHQPWLSASETVGPALTMGVYACAAYVLRGPWKIDLRLRYRRDVLRYVVVTAAAAIPATAVGVASLVVDHSIRPSQYWSAAMVWYVGDAIGLVGFAPFLLIHVLPWVRGRLGLPEAEFYTAQKLAHKEVRIGFTGELAAQLLSILAVVWVIFGRPFPQGQFFYLAFVPIIWIAMRHGIRRAVTGTLILNFGIVAALRLFPMDPDTLDVVGLLMLVVSATGLIVGAAVTERNRIARQLVERTEYFNSLIEHSPLGIVVLDPEGRVMLCNDAFENLFQLQRGLITGTELNTLIAPPEEAAGAQELTEQVARGQTVHQTVLRRRSDGEMLHVEVNAVPLISDGHVSGGYAMYSDVSEQFQASEASKEHAESLNRWVGELQLRTTQMTLLNEMGHLLQCCVSAEEAYGVVGQSARQLFAAATAGALFVFRSSRNEVEAVSTWGNSCASELLLAPDDCWGLRRGQPNWSEHPGDSILCPHIRNRVAASYLCVPMIAHGETLGILHLQYDRSESTRGTEVFETLRESQQRLVTSVAGQIALSLASLRMRETLRDQSIRDPLTGLFNRRFMQESLERELLRARRKNRTLSVVFVDLDHFKQFNDRFGHEAGDAVLRSMAELFRHHFRGDDVVCRYGGEEFAMILPESSAVDAANRAQELLGEARSTTLRYKGRALDPVTLSIGIAAFPDHGATGDELLRAADQCLYASKEQGRNCVTVAAVQEVRSGGG